MVFFAVAAAITLLPALLSLLGDRIDKGRLVRRHRPAKRGRGDRLVALRPPRLRPPVALPARRRRHPGRHRRSRRSGCRPPSRPPATRPPRPPTGRPTTCSPRASAPASTHRSWWSSTSSASGVDAAGVPALADDIAAVPGIVSVGEPQVSADGDTVVFTAIPTTGPADPDTSATIDRGPRRHPRQRLRLRDHRHHRRPQRPAQRHPAAVHRRRHRRVVPAADAGLPLDRRPAQGRGDEPALDRRRLRRPGRGLPVGLGQQPARPRGADPDHLDHRRDHVPDPVRALDGLRGVPALADPRGVRPHRRQRRVGRPRPGRHRPGRSPRPR